MILHIPHSSRHIPADLRSALLLSDEELNRELLTMTDAYTDELFQLDEPCVRRIVYPISRLIVDPERFVDDECEPMSLVGMGVIYERTSDGRRLRNTPTLIERKALLERFYHPHHDALTAACASEVATTGHCLIVDCHSFPSTSLLYEQHKESDRPDFCIGTDDFHTPESLVELVNDLLTRLGYSVALNRPFAGSLVPANFYHADQGLRSIMIEVNRRLYMDEATGFRAKALDNVAADIKVVLQSCGDTVGL